MAPRLSIAALVLCGMASGCGSGASAPSPPGSGPAVIPPGAPVQLSNDPFTDTTAQHQTAVEPSIQAHGNTLVAAFQVGRIDSGASDAIGYASSTNGGSDWTRGFLPSITSAAGGSYDNATDAVVAYDAVHGVWMIECLAFTSSGSALLLSRSTDGLSWNAPVTVATGPAYDKNWIACDNGAASPHRGTCYSEWDDTNNGGEILMSRSTDGGKTWAPSQPTGDSATGIGGQIAIQPAGNVVVPFYNANTSSPEILSFSSNDGGQSWSNSSVVSATQPGSIPVRGETDPQVSVDSNGKIYVAWFDCRFESGCSANDTVISTSTDGTSWSAPARVATDPIGSGVNHFLPTLAVNPANSSTLALMVYTANAAQCSGTSCAIQPVLSTSSDGGQSWSPSTPLGSAFPISAIANTTEGRMVGDYLSIAFVGSSVFPVFSAAGPLPAGSSAAFNQQIYTLP